MTRRPLSILLAILAGLASAVALLVTLHPFGTPADQANAAPLKVKINGSLDGARDALAFDGITVTINGKAAPLDAQGRFDARTDLAPYYRIDITGESIFTMVQTFGNAELRDEACDCLRIPAIELVAKKPGRVEMFFGGDSMAGRRYFDMGLRDASVLNHETLDEDLDRLFEHMQPYLAPSDFASINLESVVADAQPGPPAPKQYLFFSPPELPKAMARAGIDHVSLGNNHTADYRDVGLRTTIDAIDDAGIKQSGAGMDVSEAEAASRFNLNGTPISVYGFVGWRGTWTPNQTATPTKGGAAWGTKEVIERVTKRERDAGYVPIMQYHGNLEYSDRPSELSLPRYRLAVDHGAPVVIGHHPHVTHGLELYKGGLIAHSLGNFLFDQDHPHTHSTYALKVWMENGRFLRAEAVPLQMLDYRPVPAVGGMREASLRRLFWLSDEMGTHLKLTGGHASVWRENRPQGGFECRQPGNFRLNAFAPNCGDRASEYGRNLIPRGDFSNARMGAAQDRFWAAHNGKIALQQTRRGNGHLALEPLAAHKSFYLYSASYVRDTYANHFTLTGRMKLPHDAEIELITRDKPAEGAPPALSILGEQMETQSFEGSGEWQSFKFDFWLPPGPPPRLPPGPATAAHPFRPILRIKYTGQRREDSDTVLFDDIEMIEWPDKDAQRDPAKSWWWTHKRPLSEGPRNAP